MKKIIFVFTIASYIAFCNCYAQVSDSTKARSITNLGLGMGIDYGGFGARFTVNPVKEISVFLGGGTNLVGFGYNVGGALNFIPNAKFSPKLIGMYGYNGVIMIIGKKQYNKIYYGPSVGVGLEYHWTSKTFGNIEILYPFRAQQFYDDVDIVKNDPAIQMFSEPIPIAISLGLHFNL